jgi:DNA-binding NtrC family response regulator
MNSKADILIVDDEANTLASLSRALLGMKRPFATTPSRRWSWRSRALSI